MIPKITFYICASELDRLEKIAYHPRLGQQVRALQYESNTLPSRVRSYEEFLAHARTVQIVHGHLPGRLHHPDRPLFKRHTSAEFKMYYEKYKRVLGGQNLIFSTDTDSVVMIDAMSSLPRLEEITMSTGTWLGAKSKREDPYKNLCLQPSEPRPHSLSEPEGVRQLLTLIAAVEDSDTNLKILRAGKISWQFFPCFDAVQAIDSTRLCGVLRSLTTLELYIGTLSRMASGAELDPRILDVLHSQQGLKTKSMRRFLVKLPNLRVLNITFDMMRPWNNPASLSTVFSLHQTWAHLEELTLGQIKCTHETLLAVLVNHKATLKYLSLRDMALESSWPAFLHDIQKNLTLGVACICGTLSTCTANPMDEEDWYIPTPEEQESCSFRDEINRYLVFGGKCPLNKVNAMDAVIYGA